MLGPKEFMCKLNTNMALKSFLSWRGYNAWCWAPRRQSSEQKLAGLFLASGFPVGCTAASVSFEAHRVLLERRGQATFIDTEFSWFPHQTQQQQGYIAPLPLGQKAETAPRCPWLISLSPVTQNSGKRRNTAPHFSLFASWLWTLISYYLAWLVLILNLFCKLTENLIPCSLDTPMSLIQVRKHWNAERVSYRKGALLPGERKGSFFDERSHLSCALKVRQSWLYGNHRGDGKAL